MIHRFKKIREETLLLCQSLETEDYVVQPCDEVSPPKWHLAHVTWFLEELLLNKFQKNYQFYDLNLKKVFNSYYKGLGEHWVQAERGRLSRPSVKEVFTYRKMIDDQMMELYEQKKDDPKFMAMLEVAINHEEQHQELLLMDIKYILGSNPQKPAYTKTKAPEVLTTSERWYSFDEGIYHTGADRNQKTFAFDNEFPNHKVYLNGFSVRNKLVTNKEYLEFIHDGGYKKPSLWLSLGWDWLKTSKAKAPLYWSQDKESLSEFTLHGQAPLNLDAPVCHINYFEADAFARWMGARLPTEHEMETAFGKIKHNERVKKASALHPYNQDAFDEQLWCWTRSHYSPYPGFTTFEGEIAEYNGKFMCNQFVMKGGCVATPRGHNRNTYRNFFLPEQRWMFGGLTLARDEA